MERKCRFTFKMSDVLVSVVFPYLCVISPVNEYCMRDFFSFVVKEAWRDSQKTDQVRFSRSVLVSEVMTEVVFLHEDRLPLVVLLSSFLVSRDDDETGGNVSWFHMKTVSNISKFCFLPSSCEVKWEWRREIRMRNIFHRIEMTSFVIPSRHDNCLSPSSSFLIFLLSYQMSGSLSLPLIKERGEMLHCLAIRRLCWTMLTLHRWDIRQNICLLSSFPKPSGRGINQSWEAEIQMLRNGETRERNEYLNTGEKHLSPSPLQSFPHCVSKSHLFSPSLQTMRTLLPL